jgi:hypothetical protein
MTYAQKHAHDLPSPRVGEGTTLRPLNRTGAGEG